MRTRKLQNGGLSAEPRFHFAEFQSHQESTALGHEKNLSGPGAILTLGIVLGLLSSIALAVFSH